MNWPRLLPAGRQSFNKKLNAVRQGGNLSPGWHRPDHGCDGPPTGLESRTLPTPDKSRGTLRSFGRGFKTALVLLVLVVADPSRANFAAPAAGVVV